METSVSYAKRALIYEWTITCIFLNKIATMCYVDERSLLLLFLSDSLWMICLVLLKNNLINNEASEIRNETASAKPIVLLKQDGQGLKWVFKQICHNVLRGRTEPTSSFSLPILFLDLSIQQRTGEWLTWHLSTHFSPLPSCSGRTAGLGRGCFDPYVTSFIIDQIIFQKDQTNHPKWVKIHKTMIMVFSFTIQK